MKKIISIVLSICMILSGFSAFAQKPAYDDIQNHWAKTAIESWSLHGIVNGYEGHFLPDNSITRGEFATIINRIFKFDEPAENTFDDLDDNYYTEHILCLNARGIMNGFESRIRPDDLITREEAGAMLFKALGMKEQEDFKKEFHDENQISDWAKPYMITLTNQGYFNGDNGFLRPRDNITRAEAITLLDNGITIVDESAEKGEFEKVCIIGSDNLTLKDCVFKSEVFVTSDVTALLMEGVSADGTLHVLSKSDKSVTLKNCLIKDINAQHENAVYEEAAQEEEKDSSYSETADSYHDSDYSATGSLPDSSDEGSEDESENTDKDTTDETTDEPAIPEELKPVIETTLEDGIVQKNSKKVFDVIARDVNGEKAECKVRCNDINIEPSWDDDTKTSFTLEFTENGEYTIEITATDADGISQTKVYTITYEMAEYGEVIGKATICIEAFTVGGGYIVAPVETDVLEGVNCAYILDSFLAENGLSYMSTGSLDGGFYLSSIQDIPEFTPQISETLLTALSDAGFDVDTESYTPTQLTEFDFTQGSGWMYCVNGVFPNVGFSEYYLQDGDVIRIQFTLAYGSDIGGASGAGQTYAGDFYEMVNRDELTKIIAAIGIENCQEHMPLITKPDLTGEELDSLLSQINEEF